MAREALEVLKECEAFLEGHFLLSSGRHSGAYCQMAFLQQYPDKAAEVMAPVAEKLKELNIDVVVGPAMGGIVYAYELARQTGKRAIFTERVDNVMTLKRFRINRVSAASSPRTSSPPVFPASRPSASSRKTAASAWHCLRRGPHPRRGPVPDPHRRQRPQARPAQLRP